ncbi:heme ABC transporter ATP-binding protein [Teredinibacter turnerae]|uniref:heme ABC transporter ATP-binding protein n=1 Tax=Teredinibacter turnerae TaxID=2426 RepID=UPI000407A3EF|nr:heme ABC transporter ATP-binding protein [Teredinibacter turnerae]
MSSLRIEQLQVSLANVPLLRDINLSLRAGCVYSIVGANGAGKSTLLKSIVREVPRTCGNVYLGEKLLDQVAPLQIARSLAVLPQNSQLSFPFTVAEVVGLSRTPHETGRVLDSTIADEAINALDITYLKHRLYTALSGGEKQRVQIARVLAQIWREEDATLPRVLLLDEPTAFLDLGHQQQLMHLVQSFAAQGVTVLMVMHDINLAANFSDDIIAMQCGEIVAQGAPHSVLTAELIEQLFQARVHLLKEQGDAWFYALQQGPGMPGQR